MFIPQPGERHQITQTQDIDFTENQMVIREVTEADYGTYRCTAANFADTVHQNFDLSCESFVCCIVKDMWPSGSVSHRA